MKLVVIFTTLFILVGCSETMKESASNVISEPKAQLKMSVEEDMNSMEMTDKNNLHGRHGRSLMAKERILSE